MKTSQIARRILPSLRYNCPTSQISQRIRPCPVLNNIKSTARRKPLPVQYCPRSRNFSTNPRRLNYDPTPHLNSPSPSLSLSQRLRKLSREYGWSAFGVYFLLSVLDFPFCFAAVRVLGTDRIGHYEHVLAEWVKGVIPESLVQKWREMRNRMRETAEHDRERGSMTVGGLAGEETKVEAYAAPMEGAEVAAIPGYDHGVKEAEEMNKSENASR